MTRIRIVLSTLGGLLLVFSSSLLPPLLISVLYKDGEIRHLLPSLLITAGLGLALRLSANPKKFTLRTRDGFLVVSLLWIVMGLLGSLPFVFGLKIPLAAAVFEAVSGFTTTGATVLEGLDHMAPSILFYRQEIQWLGGIGVIVSAIAFMPMLRVGGMQLLRAEVSGPIKDDKLLPRMEQTARSLAGVYVILTVICALLYWIAGMSLFDAISHSLATLSTGGLSTHDASFAYFDNPVIEAIGIVFMLLGAIGFNTHYFAWHQQGIGYYWRNTETRAFLILTFVAIMIATVQLHYGQANQPLPHALRISAFETVSVITTTGFGIDDFSVWPNELPVLLIMISFIGGCAGSTAGGMKAIRFIVLGKQGWAELIRLVHPRIVLALMLEGKALQNDVLKSIWAFFALYVATASVVMLLLMSDGLDMVTAFGAVAACLNNLGPGLGKVANTFASIDDFGKWLLSLTMILGRLEIFTILVLLTPAFWRE
jgi:trk system potassium uptake protein TrkH